MFQTDKSDHKGEAQPLCALRAELEKEWNMLVAHKLETKPLQIWLQMWVLNTGPFQILLLELHKFKLPWDTHAFTAA